MGPTVIFAIVLALATCSLGLNCPGCPVNLDVKDKSAFTRLSQSISGVKSLPTGTETETVIPTKLNEATSQIVSGVKYTYDFDGRGQLSGKLYKCHLEVVARPWLQKEDEVLEYSCLPLTSRNKRSNLGEEFEISLKQIQDLNDMESLITKELEKKQQTKYAMGIVKIYKATRKVVSGFLTKLTVEVAETECLSGAANSKERCSFKKEGHQVCFVQVWDQPWLQKKQVTQLECNEKPHNCPGCVVETNADNHSVNQSLKRALFILNSSGQSKIHWFLRKINKVQTQVVSGLKYTIDFEAEDETKSLFNCTAVVLLQPWIAEEPSLADFQCKPNPQKN